MSQQYHCHSLANTVNVCFAALNKVPSILELLTFCKLMLVDYVNFMHNLKAII